MPSRTEVAMRKRAKYHRKAKATAPVLDSTNLDVTVVAIAQQCTPAPQRIANGHRHLRLLRHHRQCRL